MADNVQQWNPAAINQETDAQYAADSQRSGGASDGSDFLAPLANKLFYQLSTYTKAFADMLSNKGYANNDSDLSVLTAIMSNILTEADQVPQILAVGFSPTPTFNCAAASGFQMTLNGNITASNVTGATPGQLVAFYFVQDSVGGRTVSYPLQGNPAGWTGGAQPDPTPGSISVILFRCDTSAVGRAAGSLVSNIGTFSFGTLNAPSLVAGSASVGPLTASSVTAGTLTLTAPGTAGQVLTNVGGSFVPRDAAAVQSSQQFPGNVLGGGPYTNPYGCAMILNVTCTNTGGTSSNASVGLLCGPPGSMVEVARDAQNNSAGEMFVSAVVPAGYQYQAVGSGSFGGNCVLVHWVENPLT